MKGIVFMKGKIWHGQSVTLSGQNVTAVKKTLLIRSYKCILPNPDCRPALVFLLTAFFVFDKRH